METTNETARPLAALLRPKEPAVDENAESVRAVASALRDYGVTPTEGLVLSILRRLGYMV